MYAILITVGAQRSNSNIQLDKVLQKDKIGEYHNMILSNSNQYTNQHIIEYKAFGMLGGGGGRNYGCGSSGVNNVWHTVGGHK